MNKTIELTELELVVVKSVIYESFHDCNDLPESVQKYMDQWKVDALAALATIEDKPDSFYFDLLENLVSKI